MHSKFFSIIGIITISTLLFCSCSTNKQKLSVNNNEVNSEDEIIKSMYKEYPNLKILDTIKFKGEQNDNYVLVKTQFKDSLTENYDLVNIKKRTKEEVPFNSKCAEIEIINENQIIFHATGIYPDGMKVFPFVQKCIRTNYSGVNSEKSNFFSIREPEYFNLNHSQEYGNKTLEPKDVIDILPTLHSIQILFKENLIAGSIRNPITKTHYDEIKNQMIIDVYGCKYCKEKIIDAGNNPYIDFIEVKEDNDKLSLIIQLLIKDLEYTVSPETTLPIKNSFYSEIFFREVRK